MSDVRISLGEAIIPRIEKAMPPDFPDETYLGLDDVEAHTTRLLGSKPCASMKSTAKRFYSGDVLYSRLRPYLNKVWLADRTGLCSAEFIVLPTNDFIDGAFLKYRLNARDFVSFANSLNAGDRPRIDFDQIGPFQLPAFSIQYQRRIVVKIEELFSELEAGEENLRVARRQLGVYRQSLLKQAFEGKLTARWRIRNLDQLIASANLLAHIQSARQSRYEQQLKDWETATIAWKSDGELSSKPRLPSAPENITALPRDIASELANLPSYWSWGKLALMTLGIEYGTAAKSSKTGSCPVIRMGNLQGGEIDWDDLVFTSDETEIAQYGLAPGDVLFNRTNSPELVGKTAIYRGNRPAVFAGYLMRVNHIPDIVCSGYLNYFLNSGVAREYGNTVKTDGVNQSNINGAKLAGYPFPYCSLPEQQEIVRLLDAQFEVVERNEQEIDGALRKSDALRQAILKKAFTGRLVPQDPSDEPASRLLARLRSERESVRSGSSRNRKQAARSVSL